MFINTQNMACRSEEDDIFWSLDRTFRMEILVLVTRMDSDNVFINLTHDVICMYCGL